ncbi:MAG: HDIG domain-containing protein [Candidatus Methanofastidiosa archaeon]|nr:HDIG domain-containing protein [Candidatus Methanofastidiosa archaeon]
MKLPPSKIGSLYRLDTTVYDYSISLLESVGMPGNIIRHSISVSEYVMEICAGIDNKCKIDRPLCIYGALFHDIGRSVSHGIDHGILGSEILMSLGFPDNYSLVCERHIGGGISKEEARSAGLPPRDYIPISLEEKLVCHIDNLVYGSKRVSIDHTLKRLRKKIPSVALERIKLLNSEMQQYM